jgi:hypothetical protein
MNYRAHTAQLKQHTAVLRVHNLTWHYYRQWWYNGSMDVLLTWSVNQRTTVRGVQASCERKAVGQVMSESISTTR